MVPDIPDIVTVVNVVIFYPSKRGMYVPLVSNMNPRSPHPALGGIAHILVMTRYPCNNSYLFKGMGTLPSDQRNL